MDVNKLYFWGIDFSLAFGFEHLNDFMFLADELRLNWQKRHQYSSKHQCCAVYYEPR